MVTYLCCKHTKSAVNVDFKAIAYLPAFEDVRKQKSKIQLRTFAHAKRHSDLHRYIPEVIQAQLEFHIVEFLLNQTL